MRKDKWLAVIIWAIAITIWGCVLGVFIDPSSIKHSPFWKPTVRAVDVKLAMEMISVHEEARDYLICVANMASSGNAPTPKDKVMTNTGYATIIINQPCLNGCVCSKKCTSLLSTEKYQLMINQITQEVVREKNELSVEVK